MNLKLPERAIVTPEFIDLMIDIYKAWLNHIQETSGGYGMAGRAAANVKRVLPIVRRQNLDLHSGLDYEITRLRGAEYSKFITYAFQGTRYLVGITRHITLVDYQNRENILGELGPYRVFIPETVFSHGDLRLIHMIPERNPRSVNRHSHHYVARNSTVETDNSYMPRLTPGLHPLAASTGNCWGDVSGPAKSAIDDPDVPDLFRLLQYHLTTKGHIPPVHVENLDFDHTTPEEK